MTGRGIARAAALCIVVFLCSGHVGSPDIWYEGAAGPYNIRAMIRPPAVVPGLADVVVTTKDASTIDVSAAAASTGAEGAPAPDVMTRDANDADTYRARIWLMASGTFRVIVHVHGAKGDGTATIPVTASATIRRPMPRYLGAILAGGMLFLLVGLISIIGSAVRESLLPPGETAHAADRSRARRGMAIALVLTAATLGIGARWWLAVDREHRAILDHPWTSRATVRSDTLEFAITDSTWLMRDDSLFRRRMHNSFSPGLIRDHGKYMHLFLIRDGDMAAFAHLHPATADEEKFTTAAPALPAGRYHVFADIVDGAGGARTIATTLSLTNTSMRPNALSDSDDALWTASRTSFAATADTIADNVIVKWIGPSTYKANAPVELRADVADKKDSVIALEPYMGMAAHALVAAADGSVFVHLHPMGTVSAASQAAVQLRSPSAEGSQPMSMTMAAPDGRLAFPYSFPKPGRYRVWIEIKLGGRVLTSAHDVEVTAAP